MPGDKNSSSLRVFRDSPVRFFEGAFARMAAERMAGLPMLNPAIAVRVTDFKKFSDMWVGAAVTPWAIMALLVPASPERAEALAQAAADSADGTIAAALPGGEFVFRAMRDELLADAFILSLVSPVTQIADQPTADTVARVALDALFGLAHADEAAKAADEKAQAEEAERRALSVPATPPGALRRVIPIQIAAPQDSDDATLLTPRWADPSAPAETRSDSFFERPVSRRALFGRAAPKRGGHV